MREEYQKEISQIHAPRELIEKTKQAMQEEEERQSKQKGKVVAFPKISLAVAAILLLIIIPTASLSNQRAETEPSKNMQMHLGGKEDMEFEKIEQDKNWFEELIDAIKDFFD